MIASLAEIENAADRVLAADNDNAPCVFDLTGRPVENQTKGPGRRISWQQFAAQTGCVIPAGAQLRTKRPRSPSDPVNEPEYWNGRLRRYPMRWSDSKRRWRGWTITHPASTETPIKVLLRPLSARVTARHWRSAANDPVAPVAKRFPLTEEFAAGRFSDRHRRGAEWFWSSLCEDPAELAGGASRSNANSGSDGGGSSMPMWSRNPLALWPVEIAWDQQQRIVKRFRTLGSLARILLRAFEGAEMRDLAPAWPISKRNLPEAGRIRLRAALEVCARMAERNADSIPQWEVLEIAQAACADCERLMATRRMRLNPPANDNTPARKVA